MRRAKILFRNEAAGLLTQHDDGTFSFRYFDEWVADTSRPDISLTLPKETKEFHSKYLFPFFYHLLPEGSNREVICQFYRMDSDDYFGLLLKVGSQDCIGAIQVMNVETS